MYINIKGLLLFFVLFLLPAMAQSQTPHVTIDLQPESAEIAKSLASVLTLSRRACDTPDWRLAHDRSRAERELKKGLNAFGYYRPVIKKSFSRSDDCWTAHFDIQLGQPVLVVEMAIAVEGDALKDKAFEAYRTNPGLKVGDVLHHGKYEEIKSRLMSLAIERGYLDAKLTQHEMRVKADVKQAQIRLRLESGKRYRISALRYDLQGLDPDFIARFITLQAGDWYDSQRLTDLDRALTESGYFSSVKVRPLLQEKQDQQIPVQIDLVKRKRHYWRFGIGVETNTGPRLSLAYDNRYASSGGDTIGVQLRLSPVESELAAEYRIPLQDPLNEQLSFRGGYQEENTDTTKSELYRLGLRHSRTRGNWVFNRFIDLTHESSTVADEDQETTLVVPGVSLNGIIADARVRPDHGFSFSGELKGAHDALLSDVTFLQMKLRGKAVYQLHDKGRFIGRAELGATQTDNFDQLPASLRFFAGGDNSVRGYGYKTLGPQVDGEVIGGRNLFTMSLEYEHQIKDRWSAAVFVDAGNAFDETSVELKRSAGLGVRWDWVVARFRLDLAVPEDTTEDNFRIHFSMGTDL